MARFNYTAQKSDGETYTGVAEAPDRFELYQIIRREGGRVTSVSEEFSNSYFSLQFWNLLIAHVKEYEKILFARNLGAMLSAGLSLSRALAVIERQTKNIKLVNVVSQISSDVRRGDPLHAAIEKFPGVFPNLFVAMIRAGEEGGDVPGALKVISDQMERMHDLKKKVRGALIYPCIILIAIIGIGFLMMTQVVPTLAQTFSEMHAKLPTSTQIVIGVSNFLVHNTLFALIVAIILIVGFYMSGKTMIGKKIFNMIFLHTPVIGRLVREVNAARTARTLSSLLGSGVDILTSLTITKDVVQNVYFKEVIDDAAKAVGAGMPLSASFEKREDLYPPFVGEMMAVGEETGATVDMLKKLATYYEEEVDRKTKDMSTIIEPFLMLFIGGAVGFFAVAMIGPIYSMTQNI